MNGRSCLALTWGIVLRPDSSNLAEGEKGKLDQTIIAQTIIDQIIFAQIISK
ncbi:MAG: hypothetical protein AB8E87_03395 [Prochlorococcus sp.]|nr:hypothetical protein [Prochlorococcaceae cyanobacterium Fu_MAG_50]